MSANDPTPAPAPEARDALGTLASLPVDDLRRLALTLDFEAKVVKSLLRERTRRPHLVIAEAEPS